MAVFRVEGTKKPRSRIVPIVIAVVACVVITGLIILLASLAGDPKDPAADDQLPTPPVATPQPEDTQPTLPDEPVTIIYGEHTLQSLPGVAVNEYDPADFSQDDNGRLVYNGDGRTLVGVDVSSHQETIDWEAVKSDGIDYAMIRAGYRGYTEGGLFLDNTYHENVVNADKAGLQIGIYFFSQAINVQEAKEEAQQLLEWMEPYGDVVDLPVVFDWEFIGGNDARTKDMTGDVLSQIAAAFCAEIKAAGYEPMIYFNRDLAYMTYDLSAIDDYPFWLAEYDGAPTFYYHFEMLQYTASADVDGIDGDVDLNLYFLNE